MDGQMTDFLKGCEDMASSITKEQIDFFKYIMSLAEPYPLEGFEKRLHYDEQDEEIIKRYDATMAKKISLENGIDV